VGAGRFSILNWNGEELSMGFEQAHAEWIDGHLKKRRGERRGRLERGHAHGETLFAQNVWWRLKGGFGHLHPEYEVLDWRGRPYFADFLYNPGPHLRLLIEVKGFATHARDLDRPGFSKECNRETFFTSLGFVVISFSFDDVRERPDLCITLLRMVLSQYEPQSGPTERQVVGEKEIIRLAFSLARDIRPKDVTDHLRINNRTAVRLLQSLCSQGWLRPVMREGGRRVLCYRLARGV
jgi:hypothetical protein